MPSSNIFRLYANCLMGFIAHKGGESDEAVNYISHLLRLCERAESMECLTEDLACDYLSFYLKLGQLDEAKKLSTKLCSGKLAECVQLWVLRITIEIKCKTRSSASLSDADLSSLFELLSHSLRKFPVSKSEDLWVMVCCQCYIYISVFFTIFLTFNTRLTPDLYILFLYNLILNKYFPPLSNLFCALVLYYQIHQGLKNSTLTLAFLTGP